MKGRSERIQASGSQNGYRESCDEKLRGECLNGEIFYSPREVQVVSEKCRVKCDTQRPLSALGYRPPAPVTCSPLMPPNSTSQPMAVAVYRGAWYDNRALTPTFLPNNLAMSLDAQLSIILRVSGCRRNFTCGLSPEPVGSLTEKIA
jgi:Integrase core domain